VKRGQQTFSSAASFTVKWSEGSNCEVDISCGGKNDEKYILEQSNGLVVL
jgi:VCBS repeat-containing protein